MSDDDAAQTIGPTRKRGRPPGAKGKVRKNPPLPLISQVLPAATFVEAVCEGDSLRVRVRALRRMEKGGCCDFYVPLSKMLEAMP